RLRRDEPGAQPELQRASHGVVQRVRNCFWIHRRRNWNVQQRTVRASQRAVGRRLRRRPAGVPGSGLHRLTGVGGGGASRVASSMLWSRRQSGAGLELTEIPNTGASNSPEEEAQLTERELSRGAARRLAMIQHVEEVTGNVAM